MLNCSVTIILCLRNSLEGVDQLKTQLGNESLNEVSQKDEARKVAKNSFEETFQVCILGFDRIWLFGLDWEE